MKENLLDTLENSRRTEKKKNCNDEFETWNDERTRLTLRTKTKRKSNTMALINIMRANKESREVNLDEETLRELEEWGKNRSGQSYYAAKKKEEGMSLERNVLI